MNIIKLFTHTDLDGAGCAIVTRYFGYRLSQQVDITYCNNSNSDEEIQKYLFDPSRINSRVYIADLNISRETAEVIDNINRNNKLIPRIVLIDHHKTAYWLNAYFWARVSEECPASVDSVNKTIPISATFLLYSYFSEFYYAISNEFSNHALEKLVLDISDWDTWRWKYIDNVSAENLNLVFSAVGMDSFVNHFVNSYVRKGDTGDGIDYDSLANILRERRDQYIKSKRNSCKFVEFNGARFAVVHASSNVSVLGNYLAEEFKEDCDAVMILTDSGISLRSIEDKFDCGDFAKRLGGGGHKNAAGVSFDPLLTDISFEGIKEFWKNKLG